MIFVVALSPTLEARQNKGKANTEIRKEKTSTKSGQTKTKPNQKQQDKSTRKTDPKTSKEAKRQQQQAQREVNATAKKIRLNEQELAGAVREVEGLEADIRASETEAGTLNKNLGVLNGRISTLEQQISKGNAQLASMRSRYWGAIKQMRLRQGTSSALAFIFAAPSFNQAMRRWRYLRQFATWRRDQSEAISERVALLEKQQQELALARQQKSDALARQQTVTQNLSAKRSRKQQVVGQLQANGQALNSYMARKQQEVNALGAKADALIAAEQAEVAKRKAREDAKKKNSEAPAPKPPAASPPTKTDNKQHADARRRKPRDKSSDSQPAKPAQKAPADKKTPTPARTPAPEAQSGFAGARGSLPRPVPGSFRIINGYGRQSRGGMEGIIYDNTGIDVEVGHGAHATAVYAGTVAAIYQAAGFSNVVLVKHGDYYTVYANLSSVAVHSGQKVKQGTVIGTVAPDPDNASHGLFHFEVWKQRTRLNPSEWIR